MVGSKNLKTVLSILGFLRMVIDCSLDSSAVEDKYCLLFGSGSVSVLYLQQRFSTVLYLQAPFITILF